MKRITPAELHAWLRGAGRAAPELLDAREAWEFAAWEFAICARSVDTTMASY